MHHELIHISSPEKNHLLIEGALHARNVEELVERLTAHPLPPATRLHLDFDGAQVRDGLALLTLINTLQALSRHIAHVLIHNPPPPLAERLRTLMEQGLAPRLHIVSDTAELAGN